MNQPDKQATPSQGRVGPVDLKYAALIISVVAVFALRFVRDFDFSLVEQRFHARIAGEEAVLTSDLVYLFFETLGFLVERDWFYFTGHTVVGFIGLTVASLSLYAFLRRRYGPGSAAAGVLGLVAMLPVPTSLAVSLSVLLSMG